jgi:hypothetical protein
MIQFNELRITPDAKYLIIEAEVKSDNYFDSIYIDSIVVNKVKDIYNNEGSEKEIFIDNNIIESNKAVNIELKEGKVRKVRYIIDNNTLSLENKLRNAFISVAIITSGDSDAPAGYANPRVIASVVDLYPFYIKTLLNIKVLDSLCSNSDELVDCILKFKALELAFKTGNANLAKQYWFKYFDTNSGIYSRYFVNKNCYD